MGEPFALSLPCGLRALTPPPAKVSGWPKLARVSHLLAREPPAVALSSQPGSCSSTQTKPDP